jgi:hypothetical protein
MKQRYTARGRSLYRAPQTSLQPASFVSVARAEIINPLGLRVVARYCESWYERRSKSARSHCEYIEGMKRSFLFIATVSLTAGLSIGCCAQEPATADTTQMSREEWQARVKASRERLDLMRRERQSIVAPPPSQDEIAEAASRQVLNDTLVPGDIVSTTRGLFRFRGSPDRERKPEDFERLR